jgi:hypothetical protein
MIARGQTYRGLQIFIDGSTFEETTFDECTLVYSGLMPGQFNNCEVKQCRWHFAGPARSTLDFLATLYARGEGGRQIVEGVFNEIRQAKAPKTQSTSTPPTSMRIN